jgi:hypothetical protein
MTRREDLDLDDQIFLAERYGEPIPGVPYCDYCEKEGHTFAQCPARDDYEDADA